MRKSYRTGKIVNEVLHDVDLDIARGDMVSIVGPSGSGKSTLLHALGGLDRDYTGSIEVDGRDLHKLSDTELSDYRNRHVGFIFQSFNLLEHLTCRENVALPSFFARGDNAAPPSTARQRAADLLARVGLGDKIDASPNTLSGGQKQRVAIARALFNRPDMMLCDEPTGNLDSKTGAQVIDLFRRLNTEDDITILIVTHDPRISAVTQRTVRVEDGNLHEHTANDGKVNVDVYGADAAAAKADADADADDAAADANEDADAREDADASEDGT
jgi:ABC-type lipoprotein export system ATPase subunit